MYPVLAMLAAVCCAASAAVPVPFTTIERGDQSGIEKPRQVVVRSAAEWAALGMQHAADRTHPAADFTRATLIGVFLGSRPTAGYAVEITRIEREGSGLIVTYHEQRPGPDEMVAQMLTTPYHIAQIERFAGPIRFKRAQ
jgi:hypothetical protein